MNEEPVPAAEGADPDEAPGAEAPLVLVAEDNQVNQLLAVRMLERRGYRVGLAANGREATDAVARGGYALVLMDCQMPELDGYAATRTIRASEQDSNGTHTPIVAMTANSMAGDRERCLAAGMDDYLSKPLDAGAFDAVLGRWAPASATASAAPPLDHDAFERLKRDLGDWELLTRLLDIFRTQTPEHLEACGGPSRTAMPRVSVPSRTLSRAARRRWQPRTWLRSAGRWRTRAARDRWPTRLRWLSRLKRPSHRQGTR